jgi:NADH dehydrogenase
MKKLKILITGGTGFVGKNLIKNLNGKYTLKIITRRSSDDDLFVKCDLKKSESLYQIFSGYDVIIHLAYSNNYPENIIIAKNIISASKKNKIKKIILLSSMSAKRNFPDDYGKNKLNIEKIVKNSGINYTILRPSIIYGRGSTSFNFITDYLKKIPFFTPIIGSGIYSISPVYISDVSNAIEKCINNKFTDKKEYDLPGGSKIYFIHLINLLKREYKITKVNLHIPIFFVYIVSFIFPRIISRKNIKNLTEDSNADIKNAREDFAYNPIIFSEGVKNGLI